MGHALPMKRERWQTKSDGEGAFAAEVKWRRSRRERSNIGGFMEKYAWRAKLLDGKKNEYIKRHNEIWNEMKAVLNDAGIKNYTIWLDGNDLFGYYECEKGVEYAAKTQAESEVVKRWNEYMEDVMIMPADEKTGVQPHLEKVFEFN